jgi:hypothetical protein
MHINRPTNSKAYARQLLKYVFQAVRDSRRVVLPDEYRAIAEKNALSPSHLLTALKELKHENQISLDSVTQGIMLTPQGVQDGDYLNLRQVEPHHGDPLPETLEEIRLEIKFFANKKSRELPHSNDWDWFDGRLNDLRHAESMMIKETAGNVYVLSGQQSRLNINSTDNSTNAISISEADVFPKLRGELNAKLLDPLRRQEIIARVDELEQARGSGSYAEKFTSFLSVAADVMTIIGPFIPVLAALH